MNTICPFCDKEVRPEDKFCPNCGKELPNKDLPLPKGKIIKIYLFSIILAPLGLFWFFKYFKNPDQTKRKVAFTVLLITIVMSIFLIITNIYAVNKLKSYINLYDINSLGL